MAQVQHNEFTEIAFSEEAEDLIRNSFTAAQLQFLQNFRAGAARAILQISFGAGDEQAKNIQEHAYQRGRVDVISELLSDVAASQQRAIAAHGDDDQPMASSQ